MVKLYSISELVNKAEETGQRISDLVIEYEMKSSDLTKKEILAQTEKQLEVMRDAAQKGIEHTEYTQSGMISDEAGRIYRAIEEGKTITKGIVPLALAKSIGIATINANMGKIVAGPTAGSCGILPGALLAVAEIKQLDDEDIIRGLLAAAGLGTVVARQATLAGAAGGCQAECGVGSAMAAGGIVEMLGGSPEQVSHAFALALKNMLGLVCDPVAGLVEVPCIKRNGLAASHGISSAELSLAGIKSVIPADEVIEAMAEVGNALPISLKETSQGGLAVTETGKKIAEEFLNS